MRDSLAALAALPAVVAVAEHAEVVLHAALQSPSSSSHRGPHHRRRSRTRRSRQQAAGRCRCAQEAPRQQPKIPRTPWHIERPARQVKLRLQASSTGYCRYRWTAAVQRPVPVPAPVRLEHTQQKSCRADSTLGMRGVRRWPAVLPEEWMQGPAQVVRAPSRACTWCDVVRRRAARQRNQPQQQ